MDKKSFDKIVELMEGAGLEVRPYSGRSMYGERCLGVDRDDALDTMATIMEAAADDLDELSELKELAQALSGGKCDSMGHGQILYWPRLAWQEEDADDQGVELDTDAYEEERGRKPRGWASWVFHLQGHDEPVRIPGDWKDVRPQIIAKAVELGCDTVHVGY